MAQRWLPADLTVGAVAAASVTRDVVGAVAARAATADAVVASGAGRCQARGRHVAKATATP